MTSTTSRTIAIVVIALTALSLAACRQPFSPQAISTDLVPERVAHALDRADVSDVVWRVSQENWHEGMSLYAATYKLTAYDGLTYQMIYLEGVQSEPGVHGAGFQVVIQDKHFGGNAGSGGGIVDDDPSRFAVRIDAGGYCFDSRATEVVATTTEGRQFSSPVTNGFWLMVVNDARPGSNPFVAPLEQWAEIAARSSTGRVLYRLKLGRPIAARDCVVSKW